MPGLGSKKKRLYYYRKIRYGKCEPVSTGWQSINVVALIGGAGRQGEMSDLTHEEMNACPSVPGGLAVMKF